MDKDVRNAIEREKRIKGWLRIKKIALLASMNPSWKDLSAEWYERHQYQQRSAYSAARRHSSGLF